MARMMRCKGPADTWVGGNEESGALHVELFAGLEVDFDRVLNPKTGFTLGEAFAGREELFEAVTGAESADEPE